MNIKNLIKVGLVAVVLFGVGKLGAAAGVPSIMMIGSGNKDIDIKILEGIKIADPKGCRLALNNKFLAFTVLGSEFIKFWNIENWNDSGIECGKSVQAIALSPVDDVLSILCKDGEIQIWDLNKNQRIDVFVSGSWDDVYQMKFAPDGNLLVVSGCTHPRVVVKWFDVKRKELILETGGCTYINEEKGRCGIVDIAFDPTGTPLYCGIMRPSAVNSPSAVNKFVLCNLNDGKCVCKLERIGMGPWHIWDLNLTTNIFADFQPSGCVYGCSLGLGELNLWDLKSCECVCSLKCGYIEASDLAISPDGTRIALNDKSDKVFVVTDRYAREALQPGKTTVRPWIDVFKNKI